MTRLEDAHANAVCWALQRQGVPCEIFDIYDVVAGGSATVRDDMGVISWRCERKGELIEVELEKVACAWMRRHNREYFDFSRVHADDLEAVKRELAAFSDSIHGLVALRAKASINSLASRFSGSLKTNQIKIANDVGLITPDTLISNNPKEVAIFLDRHQRAIFKPYNQNIWSVGDNSSAVQHAALVDRSILLRPEAISLCPGIYQSYVEKAYELRVVVMGSKIHCAKIDSQSVDVARVDWRNDYMQRVDITRYEDLPEAVSAKILEFMRRMDLSFGCLDMAVTPTGDYVFFEVNEQGQFLWIEERAPDMRLLELFVRYLCECAGITSSIEVTLNDYFQSKECLEHDAFYNRRYRIDAAAAVS
ncbi:ATP-grasp domain-containing protein [Dyella terrae]|uniref:ATP-grasp domain-containing protein n=1 Tax=Dyella terrae TaxID=522259 RepID=UPI001EFE846D|nr:hypothetical protein [Dyella terrae]